MPSIVQSIVAALPAPGHDLADHLEQGKHLQQVVERRAAGGHGAWRLVLDPDVAPGYPGGRGRGQEDEPA